MNTSSRSWTGCATAAIVLLAGSLFGPPTRADDTELYFNGAAPTAPAPLVMFTLDWRSNLGSEFCASVGTDACKASFGYDESDAEAIGTQIYNALDVTSGKVSLFDSFRAVFKVVFDSDVADGTRVGFMMNHNNDNGCTTGSVNCSNGGYVLRGFELFDTSPAGRASKDELLQILKDIPVPSGALAHPYQGLELFFELYRYLAGLNVVNGKLGYTDFESKTPGGTDTRTLDYEFSRGRSNSPGDECLFTVGANSGDNRRCLDYVAHPSYLASDDSNLAKGAVRIPSTLTWDPTILRNSGNSYTSPYVDGQDWSCSGAYSINLLFQVSQQDPDSNAAITQTLANQGLREWGLLSNPSLTFTNIISKLHQQDHANNQVPGVVPNVAGNQMLTSYFLVDSAHANTTTNGYAAAGGTGNAIAALDDPLKLFKALTGIFNEINAVSSSYVAVTVPVNADNKVESLANVFVALFQVDETGKPFWPGNVKKLDIVTTTNPLDGSKQLDVNDANGAAAFNTITGRLKDTALTLWTVPTATDVVTPDASKGEVTGKDGSSVRRGGAGHKTPGYRSGSVGLSNLATGARQIFLEPATVNGALAAGNPMTGLDASTTSALRNDPEIQRLLGIRDPTGACPGWDGATNNFCMAFIGQVLGAAYTSITGTNAAKAERATLLFLKWIRGYDVFFEVASGSPPDGSTTTVQRRWMLGDVLHSRPVAVNYGPRSGYSVDNQDVRLLFGSNDGLLRMVRNTAAGATDPSAVTQRGDAYGAEVWAFMPRELLAHVPELAMNFGNVGLNRPYGADGPPTLSTIDTNDDGIIENDGSCTVGANDCDRAWVYFGLRRGGKSYFAVDISNPDAAIPNLLWKINESTAGFTELGMTFSSPRVGWVRFEDVTGLNRFDLGDGPVNIPVPVVIFGGGYHGHAVTSGDHHQDGVGGPSKDTILTTPYTGADTNEGNAIFIVHARTGQLLWKATFGIGSATATNYQNASMEHGIAAPVLPMDADGDEILDRLYVADTGGRVWRVDIPAFVPGISTSTHRADTWKATVMADLRPTDPDDLATDDLRFFHGATIVRRARDSIGLYDAIAVGSGDREHPQSEVDKNNWFFLFKDRFINSGDPAVTALGTPFPYDPGDLHDVTNDCFNGSGGSASCDATTLEHGWKLALEETGEKNLSEPLIGGNGIIFTTYLPQGIGPDDAQCVPLGASRLYQVSLESGAPLRFLHGVVGDTFSATDRWINLYSGIDGGVVAVSPDFWITSSGKSGKYPPRKPVGFYWRESGVDTVK